MQLKINRTMPTIAVDSTVIVTKQNGTADILFLQMVQEGPDAEANTVAAIRIGTIDDLKELSRTIQESIEKHEKAEA